MDRIDSLKAFVAVVSEGSFARAAERLDLSPQLVSKYVSQLEAHLNTRLLNRTTRQVNITEAGSACFQRAQQILADMDDLENQLGELQNTARGVLRISAPVSFAISHLAKPLTEFQAQWPDVRIDLQLNDRKVDIIEEGFDIALRIGRLQSSSLIARHIAPIRLVTCASPEYLKQYGTPQSRAELKDHRYLHYSYATEETILVPGAGLSGQLNSAFQANNGDVLTQAAIAGAGIVVQPTFIAGPAIREGKLQVILQGSEPEAIGLYAVYAHRQLLSGKVRSFLDFISDYYGDTPYWDNFS
ncbi:LysR family transcriptional regulator [Thalassolituus sp. ST750PaO-4]|uniref:LysR family transcriptional regulator n=1 Tax=Thalassolituus sp. ST750PaO-4 TaxID=2742965 RepID=UPI001CE2AD3F|nr:LysR family transcriptional regulator [Thalassolituus sp. ST750PaO-4]MCA6058146.1 LysR family transcriptional regulator [Thalassolituus sp. ST750PaO-4]